MRSRATPAAPPHGGGRAAAARDPDRGPGHEPGGAGARRPRQPRLRGGRRARRGRAEAQRRRAPRRRQILEQAQQAQQPARQPRRPRRAPRSARGDSDAAADALGRVIALDPRHPVVGELSGELNRSFRRQAEDSRRQTEAARTAAEQARASVQASFARGRASCFAAAETSFRREEFTVAAQKYQQARLAFERAKRESDEARAAAAAPAARPAAVGAADGRRRASPRRRRLRARPGPSPLAPTAAPASSPVPSPTIAAALTPPPTRLRSASPYATLAPPAATSGDASEAAVASRDRGLQARDREAGHRALPHADADPLAGPGEGAARVVQGDQVLGGRHHGRRRSRSNGADRATVRVTRQDMINGRPDARPSPDLPSRPLRGQLADPVDRPVVDNPDSAVP